MNMFDDESLSLENCIENLLSSENNCSIEQLFEQESSEDYSYVEALESEISLQKFLFSLDVLESSKNNPSISTEGFIDASKAAITNLLGINPFNLLGKLLFGYTKTYNEITKSNKLFYHYFKHANKKLVEKICEEIFNEDNKKHYKITIPWFHYISIVKGFLPVVVSQIKNFEKNIKDNKHGEYYQRLQQFDKDFEKQIINPIKEQIEKIKDDNVSIFNAIVYIASIPEQVVSNNLYMIKLSKTPLFDKKTLNKSLKLESIESGEDNKKCLSLLTHFIKKYVDFYKFLFNEYCRGMEDAISILNHINSEYKKRAHIFAPLGIGDNYDKDEK